MSTITETDTPYERFSFFHNKRVKLARNPNTPLTVLEELADDTDSYVRAAVIKRAKELADTDFAAYITAIAKSYN